MPQRVYLQAKDLVKQSRRHCIYAGDPAAPKTDAGHPTRMLHATFINGVAHNLPEQTYKVLKDLGHVGTSKPVLDEDEE